MLAGRDVTKFEAVYTRRCYEVFTHLNYTIDYNNLKQTTQATHYE